MRRPMIHTRCVADHYHAPNERIAEITSGDKGCLLSVLQLDNGELLIQVYRADTGVSVTGPTRMSDPAAGKPSSRVKRTTA